MRTWTLGLGVWVTAAVLLAAVGVAAQSWSPSVVVETSAGVSSAFREITGLEASVEVIEYRDAGDSIVRKRPGKAKYANITLKRGDVNDGRLDPWYQKTLSGVTERKSGSIIYRKSITVVLLDRRGAPVRRYTFFEAWPCRWKAPELHSGSDNRLVEELEFAVERVERG